MIINMRLLYQHTEINKKNQLNNFTFKKKLAEVLIKNPFIKKQRVVPNQEPYIVQKKAKGSIRPIRSEIKLKN